MKHNLVCNICGWSGKLTKENKFIKVHRFTRWLYYVLCPKCLFTIESIEEKEREQLDKKKSFIDKIKELF